MTRRGKVLALCSIAFVSVACGPELSGTRPSGWMLVAVPNTRPAEFVQGDHGTISVQALQAAGFLVRPFSAEAAPLNWRWRVDASPAPVPADAVGRDDRPLAVHVVFGPPDQAESAMSGLRRWLRGAAVHPAFKGRVLTYMWGGTAPAGTRLPNPYLREDGWLIILRGPEAPTGVWLEQRIDPAGDYRALFGRTAPRITHIAISADTEDSGGCALAHIVPPREPSG